MLQGKTSSIQKAKQTEQESVVRKLMLDSWNQSIFSNIKERLQSSAMKLVHNERNGEAFDSQVKYYNFQIGFCSKSEFFFSLSLESENRMSTSVPIH